MEILLWLVPPVVASLAAMVWVGWVQRERPEVDPEQAVLRLGQALRRPVRRSRWSPSTPASTRRGRPVGSAGVARGSGAVAVRPPERRAS